MEVIAIITGSIGAIGTLIGCAHLWVSMRKVDLEIKELRRRETDKPSPILRPTADEIVRYSKGVARSTKILGISVILVTCSAAALSAIYAGRRSDTALLTTLEASENDKASLQADNRKLRKEVTNLRSQIAALRDENRPSGIFVIYEESVGRFQPSLFMPSHEGIAVHLAQNDKAHSGTRHIRFRFRPTDANWAGVLFGLDGEWKPKEGFDLLGALGAKKGDRIACRFWAKSPTGATVQFRVGGLAPELVKDEVTLDVNLSKEWRKYEIDLAGKDLSSLRSAFGVVCDFSKNDQETVVDLDSIRFELAAPSI